MILGLRRLLQQDRFTNCAVCAAALSTHRTDSDTVREFVQELCAVVPADAAADTLTPRPICQLFYELYEFYCKSRGRKAFAGNVFGKRLGDLHISRQRAGTADLQGRRPWYYSGVFLNGEGREWLLKLQRERPGLGHIDYVPPPAEEPADRTPVSVGPS